MEQVQDDEYDDNDDQDVDPIAGFGEAMKYIPSKSAKQPQDQQNNDDSPQHEISPFETAVGSHLVCRPGSS
jgi:hypothetical protein